jgi:DHA2 family multidrug resistance protein
MKIPIVTIEPMTLMIGSTKATLRAQSAAPDHAVME